MKRTTKYVGLDVHQATTVASVRDDTGRVLARSVLETHGASIVEFLRGMRGAIHVAFEVGTQSQWVYELVAPFVDRVVVCDPRQVARQGNKGDQVDADRLSELLRLGGLRPVYQGSAHRADLKELTRTYRTLVEDSTRVMLRIKALFRARGIKTPGSAVYHPTRRAQWPYCPGGWFVIPRANRHRPSADLRMTEKARCLTSTVSPPARGTRRLISRPRINAKSPRTTSSWHSNSCSNS
jgi:transposase